MARGGKAMQKTILVSELRPGMQIVDTGADWMSRPYLYAAEERVTSQDQIQRIVDDGYLEVIIDLARSDAEAFTGPLNADPGIASGGLAGGAILQEMRLTSAAGPLVSLAEEMPRAVKAHNECLAYARRFMHDIRSGKADLAPASTVVENIMDSLERNTDALLSLSRLHRNDTYTYTHCVNVCLFSTMYARYTGEASGKVFAAGFAGLFHDLGKALVPPTILNAPRGLTKAEFEVMKRHPRLGYDELASVPGIMTEVLQGTLEHHEKHNGTGYPQKLGGEDISLIGRVVAVSDVYDALSSVRPYKGAMYPHKALGIMYQGRGKDFHPEILAHFIRMVGIYPVGSVVELDDGYTAVVSATNLENPARPTVKLALDPSGQRVDGPQIDLASARGPNITRCVPEEYSGVNAAQALGVPA